MRDFVTRAGPSDGMKIDHYVAIARFMRANHFSVGTKWVTRIALFRATGR